MLTKNRREYLNSRSQKDKSSEYDYRILKWLETMLDSGPDGGIGDINKVLDTLDRDAIRKHLKDKNVEDLLKLIEKLLDIMDFMPVGSMQSTQEVDFHGIKINPLTYYVSKSIIVAPVGSDGAQPIEPTYLGWTRTANEDDHERQKMLQNHVNRIECFIEPKTTIPDFRSAEYYKDQIKSAHDQGLVVMGYDIRWPSVNESLLGAIKKAQSLGHPVPPNEQIAELEAKVAKEKLEEIDKDKA